MFNSQPPHHIQDAADASAAYEIGDVDLEPTHLSCLICDLRDAADRRITKQRLASARQNRLEVLGALFCPLHAWRA